MGKGGNYSDDPFGFGSLFDLDGDGKSSFDETAFAWTLFDTLMEEEQQAEEDDDDIFEVDELEDEFEEDDEPF